MIEDSADKRVHSEETHDDDDDGARESNREDLEKRLAELTLDIRAETEEAERKRRATTRLEAREFVEGITPPASRAPDKMEMDKVVIAPGVDPQSDPTLVGRRNERLNRWEFIADGDIVDVPDSPTAERTPQLHGQTNANAVVGKTELKRERLIGLSLLALLAIAVPLLIVVRGSHRNDTILLGPTPGPTAILTAKTASPPSPTESPATKTPGLGIDAANILPGSNDVVTLEPTASPTTTTTSPAQSTRKPPSDRNVAGREPLGGKVTKF